MIGNTGKKCINYEFGGISFYLPQRYVPVASIGGGAYGAVINAKDNKTNNNVAIKKLKPIADLMDLKRALREVMIMKYIEHENIIKLYDVSGVTVLYGISVSSSLFFFSVA